METIRYHVKPFEGANMDPASLAVNGIDPDHPLRRRSTNGMLCNAYFARCAGRCANSTVRVRSSSVISAAFDLGFINEAIARTQMKRSPFHPFSCFDTATLCGVAYGQTVLARAVKAAGLDWDETQAHSAAYDAEVTADIFCDVVNRFQPIFESLRSRQENDEKEIAIPSNN